jgi:hypothetical protein
LRLPLQLSITIAYKLAPRRLDYLADGVDHQFMAYGAPRKGMVTIPCSEMDSLDDSRRMQIQYLVNQPDHSRFYPPADTTERYAVMGFGMGVLPLIVSIVSFVWGFLPKKSTQLLR